MRQVSAEISAIDSVGPFARIRFFAPNLALEPGRAILARSTCTYLRRTWWPCAIDDDGFAVLFGRSEPADLRVGDRIDVLGAVGRGFQVEDASRNILLVAAGSTEPDPDLGPLLPLIDRGLSAGRSVTLAYAASSADQAYPIASLPPAIEVIRAIETRLIDLLSDAIAWADQIYVSGPIDFSAQLAGRIQAIRFTAPRGFVQALHRVELVCGVGACGVCWTGSKLACVDGPVFELRTRPERS